MTVYKSLQIGINTYEDPSACLAGCLNDVADIFDIATQLWGFTSGTGMRAICDNRADTISIRERMAWAKLGLTSKTDRLLLHYSGHGSQVNVRNGDTSEVDGLTEIICPFDMVSNRTYWDNPITDNEFGNILKSIPPEVYVIFIADCCHSGTLTRSVGNPHPRKSRFYQPPLDIRLRANGQKKPRSLAKSTSSDYQYDESTGCVFLSGCRDSQTSADATFGDRPNGALTATFRDVVREMPNAEWLKIHENIIKRLKNQGFEQVPQLVGPKARLERPIWSV